MASLQTMTARLDTMLAPVEKSAAPLQQSLAPLEGLGKQMVAWIGCALIFVGMFLPVKTWTVSIAGFSGATSDNYWSLNTFESIIFLILIAAVAAAAYLRLYAWLWVIGALLFVLLFLGFINTFFSGYSGVGAHPSWGWILLFPGVIAILAAAAMRDTGKRFGA